MAPINAFAVTDVNGDGFADIIAAGNEYQADVVNGRYDASYGTLLLGDGKGGFGATNPTVSGMVLDGDVKSMLVVNVGKRPVLLAAANNAALQSFAVGRQPATLQKRRLVGRKKNRWPGGNNLSIQQPATSTGAIPSGEAVQTQILIPKKIDS